MHLETLSLETVLNGLDFWKREAINQWNAWKKKKKIKNKKELLLLANKSIEKISDRRNAKEYYHSFVRKKKEKSVKQSEIIIDQPNTFENINIVDIKSVIIENISKIIQNYKTEKFSQVASNSSLYSALKKF